MLSVYYTNFRNTRGSKKDLPWAQADAAFLQCVLNAADRKAVSTFISYFERLILAEMKDKEKDKSRHLMGLLTLVSLALNNIEDPNGEPSTNLIPFIKCVKWDKTFHDPIHCLVAIMYGITKTM